MLLLNKIAFQDGRYYLHTLSVGRLQSHLKPMWPWMYFGQKIFASVSHLTRKKITLYLFIFLMHITRHELVIRIWHVLWLLTIKLNKVNASINMLETEMTCTTSGLILMWQFKLKCRCHLTIIFCLWKTPCDTLDLKLNVKWNLSNIHLACDQLMNLR